jgi:hypothetical protein
MFSGSGCGCDVGGFYVSINALRADKSAVIGINLSHEERKEAG